jgi:hypothetical protein
MTPSPLIARDIEYRLASVETRVQSIGENVDEHQRILITGRGDTLPLPEQVRNVYNWQRNFDKYAFVVIALLITIVAQNLYSMYIKFASTIPTP